MKNTLIYKVLHVKIAVWAVILKLDQTKRSVLNSPASLQSRRSYQHAMDEFIDWYCSEPRLALNRGVVLRYGRNWKLSNLHQRPSTYDSLPSGGFSTKQPILDC